MITLDRRGHVHRDHNLRAAFRACRWQMPLYQSSSSWGLVAGRQFGRALDGPADGLGRDGRYPELVMDAHPLCWRSPSRLFVPTPSLVGKSLHDLSKAVTACPIFISGV